MKVDLTTLALLSFIIGFMLRPVSECLYACCWRPLTGWWETVRDRKREPKILKVVQGDANGKATICLDNGKIVRLKAVKIDKAPFCTGCFFFHVEKKWWERKYHLRCLLSDVPTFWFRCVDKCSWVEDDEATNTQKEETKV